MKNAAVLFDLDGTLLNTIYDITFSLNAVLRDNGLPEHTVEEIQSFVGNGSYKLIELAVPEMYTIQLTKKVFDEYEKYYAKNCDIYTVPYEHIYDMLNSMTKDGYKLGIVSNKPDYIVKKVVEKYFPLTFDFVCGQNKEHRRKPYPDSIFAAMNSLGVDSRNTIYVGDSDVDIRTAHNASVRCISVSWGFRSKDILKESGATVIINEPLELIDILHME